MRIVLNTSKTEDYRLFLRIRQLPRYRIAGHECEFSDEYASTLGLVVPPKEDVAYDPWPGLFDYQVAFSRMEIRKRKFAMFVEPGYGKTFCASEFCRHALQNSSADRCMLIVSPLMVIKQTVREIERFYGGALPIEQVRTADLQKWLVSGTSRLGITNYEAMKDGLRPGRLSGLVLDESSLLKSAYGKWGTVIIELGRGLEWKLCLTGTPAPNDRIEYANHAVFLDQFPTTNSFLARFFVNRGQTDNRWELKPHALKPFYTHLSHWCVFMSNPATYGFKDNAGTIPPIHVHIHDVPLTDVQQEYVAKAGGDMFGTPGGITSRARLGQLAKGRVRLGPKEYDEEGVPLDSGKVVDVPTNKPKFIRDLVDSWDESTIIWCLYNHEQELMEKTFPDAGSISGSTPHDERERIVGEFQSGRTKILISKARVLGFGLNLQVATRQVFSGLADSYESYFQAVKRSNRVGSTVPLNVHIPITSVERAMVETVLVKAARVQKDTEEQEAIFKESGTCF